MTRPLRTSLALISILLIAVVPGPRPVASGEEGDSWQQMLDFLRILSGGEPSQKRSLAGHAYLRLSPLFEAHHGHDDEEAQVIFDEVRDLVRVEKDDFVPWAVLNDLGFRHDTRLTPIFLDALRDVSPNLRWAGIKWFSGTTSPEAMPDLEFAWHHESRPWVRSDLIAALARQGCADHIEEFISIARGEDAALAKAALEALSALKDDRALPVIVSLARNGPAARRRAALHGLAAWPASADALEALLLGSRSDDDSLKAIAVESLASFGAPGSSDRLEEIISEEADPSLRSRALEALSGADPARAVPILIDVLHRTGSPDLVPMKEAAAKALMEIDDPATFDPVSDLDPAADPELEFEFKAMLESLGRDRRTEGKSYIVSTSCSFPGVIIDPADPAMRVIRPQPWLESVRCWRTPGLAGDPGDFPRIKAGTPIRVETHFESEGRSWVRVTTAGYGKCWTPIDFVMRPSGPPEAGDVEAHMLMRREFDLPAGEVESDVAQGLMDAGLLEVIEPGEEVIGVAVTIDPEDFDRVLLLARSCGLNETMLDGELYEIVADLAPLYRGHPALDRFRRTPQVRSGESDEVIDLDIEELSDQ